MLESGIRFVHVVILTTAELFLTRLGLVRGRFHRVIESKEMAKIAVYNPLGQLQHPNFQQCKVMFIEFAFAAAGEFHLISGIPFSSPCVNLRSS